MRLRRVYETVEEDGLPLEQVAVERFGSLQAFEEAKEERRILDEREGKQSRGDRGRVPERPTHFSKDGEKRLMFTDVGGSGGSSRSSSFRRPGGVPESGPSTPSPAPDMNRVPANRRLDSLRLPSQANSPLAQSHTPIPTVMTPPLATGSKIRALSPSSLNKLQAKVIRAKLMNSPDAELLEREYEEAARRAHGTVEGGIRKKVEVLPTLDARGRMYDVGHGKEEDKHLPGNRKKKENVCYFSPALAMQNIRLNHLIQVRDTRPENGRSASDQSRRRYYDIGRDAPSGTYGSRYGGPEGLGRTVRPCCHGRRKIRGMSLFT
jgi:hypothetical protein